MNKKELWYITLAVLALIFTLCVYIVTTINMQIEQNHILEQHGQDVTILQSAVLKLREDNASNHALKEELEAEYETKKNELTTTKKEVPQDSSIATLQDDITRTQSQNYELERQIRILEAQIK